MCFEQLHDSAQRGELLMIDGGMCRYHVRRDGQLTIHEIISTKPGAGVEMLRHLTAQPCRVIVAKCPADLPANEWYARRGFVRTGEEQTKSGRMLNIWSYWL